MLEHLSQLGADKTCGLLLFAVIVILVAVECITTDRRKRRNS